MVFKDLKNICLVSPRSRCRQFLSLTLFFYKMIMVISILKITTRLKCEITYITHLRSCLAHQTVSNVQQQSSLVSTFSTPRLFCLPRLIYLLAMHSMQSHDINKSMGTREACHRMETQLWNERRQKGALWCWIEMIGISINSQH